MIESATYHVKVSTLTGSQATPPGSKSLTNRALLLAALAEGESTIRGALDAEDSRVMIDALRALGVEVTVNLARREIRVLGCGGVFPTRCAELYIANSGTSARFLTAALALADGGEYRIDGTERMRERPIGDLLDALRALGADARAERGNDCPPLLVRGGRVVEGANRVAIAANVSSQFLSGLLMAAPLARRALTVEIDGELVSKPYCEMTLAIMRDFGVQVAVDSEFRRFTNFDVGHYVGRVYDVEPDASAASYFFALPAILGGAMTIHKLSRNALQGDVAFVECLERMGCRVTWRPDSITVERQSDANGALIPLRGIDVDMNACSDVAQTLAVVALFANSPTSIRNVANMRVKETDRLAALANELAKLGADVQERPDGITIFAQPNALHPAKIATYDDHRMAMSFALAGLKIPGVVIENPACVAKTYPDFFEDLERVTTPVQ